MNTLLVSLDSWLPEKSRTVKITNFVWATLDVMMLLSCLPKDLLLPYHDARKIFPIRHPKRHPEKNAPPYCLLFFPPSSVVCRLDIDIWLPVNYEPFHYSAIVYLVNPNRVLLFLALKEPHVGKEQDDGSEEGDPDLPAHTGSLGHEEHAVHGAAEADSCRVECVVHLLG